MAYHLSGCSGSCQQASNLWLFCRKRLAHHCSRRSFDGGRRTHLPCNKKLSTVAVAAVSSVATFGVVALLNDDSRAKLFRQKIDWDDDWDSAWRIEGWQNENLGGTREAKGRRLLLIRHGQYVMGECDEQRVLTQLGTAQAKLTAQRVAELLKNKRIRAVIHSDMQRARETAKHIIAALPPATLVLEDPDIREGWPAATVPRSIYEPETCIESSKRIESAFRKYVWRPQAPQSGEGEQEVTILVCHGNVIRYFLCRALQFPGCGWLRWATPNCGLTHIYVSSAGRVSCLTFGDSGHLPADQVTFN